MDRERAFLRTHQQNIERYQRLLKTKLSDLETQFLEKRLTEERFWLAMLTKSSDLPAAAAETEACTDAGSVQLLPSER